MEHYSQTYPEFMKIVDLVSRQNSLQRKRINNFILRQAADYWGYAEEICRIINQSFLRNEQEEAEAARSYNRMSMDLLREQVYFSKTGTYRLADAGLAQSNIYDQPEVMRYYMIGLLLSYLLWPNHFKMLWFFKAYLKQAPAIGKYLEIAPGHGLFAVEVLRSFPELKAEMLDISETSLRLTSEVFAAFQIDSSRHKFINGDFLTVPMGSETFDFISMGEVLEHVNDPADFLERARQLLAPRGTIFMSTCANCPAIDHVYHFHNADEIRSMAGRAGLSIINELVLPVETAPQEGFFKELIPLNYCAVLSKGN